MSRTDDAIRNKIDAFFAVVNVLKGTPLNGVNEMNETWRQLVLGQPTPLEAVQSALPPDGPLDDVNYSPHDERGEYVPTLCHVAAMFNHLDVMELLLSRGADPDRQSLGGRTVCCIATELGHRELVALLLRHHADPNKAAHDGTTPCHFAAAKGYDAIVKLLLSHGANPNALGTPVHVTACYVAASHGKLAVLTELLAHGADPNLGSSRWDTPVYAAAEGGFVAVVRRLVASGAMVPAACGKWYHSHTPLALAAYLNGIREWTPLHRAADARDVGALRRLLRDPRVDPRMAACAERPDMRTALSIAKSDAYPTAVTADSNTREAMVEVLEAAELITWSPATHRLCSADVRKAARARALLLGARGIPVLNADVWGAIFAFLVEGRGPRSARVDEAAFVAGIA